MTPQVDVGSDPTVATAVPLLTRATPLIGHFQIRNRGTLGGSIAHADPAAEYPAVAAALDAEMEVRGAGGSRRIPASEFFEATFMTAVAEDEILTAVHFPVWTGQCGFAAEEVARRHGDFALVGVMAAVQVEAGSVARAGLSLFGVAGTPARARAAEAALVGAVADQVDAAEIGRLATADLNPPGDIHASGAYRRSVGAALVERAVTRALEEATTRD
jgi:carbon-monoxide dehydrogenase medium subunit